VANFPFSIHLERWLSARSRILFGLLAVFLLVCCAGFFFLRYQVVKSFPEDSGRVTLPGLQQPALVERNAFGVPLVKATLDHDLAFVLGYVHAQDRLWQMDMARRVGEGRMSEIFGVKTIPFDKMFRTIGIHRVSKQAFEAMDAESRERLIRYADGVNAFIASHKGRYPVEFDMLNYEPESWNPVHSVIIGRLMAWELNLSWWTDLTYGILADRVGLEKVVDVFPTFPETVLPAVPSSAWRNYAHGVAPFLQNAQDFIFFAGIGGTLGGSNAWVVSPQKSASGEVLLANDTHLHLQAPSKFYDVRLRSPGYAVDGFSIPGVPVVVIGSNEHIAWGLTNLMADDADFYIEDIDTVGQRYRYQNSWKALMLREEEIGVKDDTTIILHVRSTHHGPIISDFSDPFKKTSPPFVVSMRWTGFEVSDQIGAFDAINRARDWKSFLEGVKKFSGPGQNFVYGDTEGNIGYWCGVWLPVRGKQNTTMPLPGWDPSVEWKGFVPFEKLPHLFNPTEHYIATANNKIVDDSYPYHISDLWEPPSRIQRLREVLGSETMFTAEDFARLQTDTYSVHAREMMEIILPILEDSSFVVQDKERLLTYLRNWTHAFSRDDIATTIYQQFLVELLKNIYIDEMGGELFHDFVLLVNVPIRVTQRLLTSGVSSWFDNIVTEQIETRDDIVQESMRSAMSILARENGVSMKNWRWGEKHTVTLRHPFGIVKPLDAIFDIGPFSYAGGSTTLVSGEYSFNEPFTVTVGASLRQIVDMGRPLEARRVLPTGQSGQVFHRHYDDQTPLWLNGSYRSVDNSSVRRLVLEPPK